jgi:CRP-like cAMP-binding protein
MASTNALQSRTRQNDLNHDIADSTPSFIPLVTSGFELIKSLPSPCTIDSESELLEQGKYPEFVSLISTGLIKMTYVSPDGVELNLGIRSAGWYAGGVCAYLNTISTYSVHTITECAVIRFPASNLSLMLMENMKLMQHFMTSICCEVAVQSGAQAQIMAGTAEERLQYFMDERMKKSERWKTIDPLPILKQMELAQLLAVTPEHLSRILRKKLRPSQNNR